MITLQLPDSDPGDAGVLQGDSQPGLGGELQCSADEVSAQFQQWAFLNGKGIRGMSSVLR